MADGGPRLKNRTQSVFAAMSMAAVLAIPVASTAAPGAKSAPADPARVLPAASVDFKVSPGSNGAPWRLSIENTGEGPIRIPADPRLLVLDLVPPDAATDTVKKPASDKKKAATPLRCILPDDARPSTDDGSDLVIPPKRSWSASFDPLFYCFGARERAALVPGTSVKALFGWPSSPRARAKTSSAPPFALTPVGASASKVAPAKVLEADAIMLSEAVVSAKPSADSGSSETSEVWLSVPESMDAARGRELGTTVTLTNGTDRPITLLFRPASVQFNVTGPSGSVSCGSPQSAAAPIPELYSTVPVRGKTTVSVLFTTTCPAGTFDVPGIYRITPRLDTTAASARSLGMRTWEGVALGRSTLILRVRSPRKPALPTRPTLD